LKTRNVEMITVSYIIRWKKTLEQHRKMTISQVQSQVTKRKCYSMMESLEKEESGP